MGSLAHVCLFTAVSSFQFHHLPPTDLPSEVVRTVPRRFRHRPPSFGTPSTLSFFSGRFFFSATAVATLQQEFDSACEGFSFCTWRRWLWSPTCSPTTRRSRLSCSSTPLDGRQASRCVLESTVKVQPKRGPATTQFILTLGAVLLHRLDILFQLCWCLLQVPSARLFLVIPALLHCLNGGMVPDVHAKTLVFISVATPDRHRDGFQRQGVAHISQIELIMVLREVGGADVDDGFLGLLVGQCYACDGTYTANYSPHKICETKSRSRVKSHTRQFIRCKMRQCTSRASVTTPSSSDD